MKKFIYIAIMGIVIWSCGGSDDPPPPANEAPTTPVQVYPANNDFCINNSVNFQWNASTDDDSSTITYLVEVSKSSTFSTIAQSKNVTSTSTTIPLDKGTIYYWRVKATDSEGLSSNPSSGNEFYTEGLGDSNYLPFSPVLVAPDLGSTVQTSTTTLQWTASDVDNDTLTYDVYFGTNENPTTVVSANQTANSYTTPTLTSSTKYYWKIVVKDGKGGQTIGQVWNFVTD
jgi:hypothetical protein